MEAKPPFFQVFQLKFDIQKYFNKTYFKASLKSTGHYVVVRAGICQNW